MQTNDPDPMDSKPGQPMVTHGPRAFFCVRPKTVQKDKSERVLVGSLDRCPVDALNGCLVGFALIF